MKVPNYDNVKIIPIQFSQDLKEYCGYIRKYSNDNIKKRKHKQTTLDHLDSNIKRNIELNNIKELLRKKEHTALKPLRMSTVVVKDKMGYIKTKNKTYKFSIELKDGRYTYASIVCKKNDAFLMVDDTIIRPIKHPVSIQEMKKRCKVKVQKIITRGYKEKKRNKFQKKKISDEHVQLKTLLRIGEYMMKISPVFSCSYKFKCVRILEQIDLPVTTYDNQVSYLVKSPMSKDFIKFIKIDLKFLEL